MNYELAKELKEAGFPQDDCYFGWYRDGAYNNVTDMEGNEPDCANPTLSELIEACGDRFYCLSKEYDEWEAVGDQDCNDNKIKYGKTPEEAVAYLWLALNNQ